MSDATTGFAVIYRFRVRPEAEAEFVAAWSAMTALIRQHRGGRGSRLHRGDDGVLYAYAQWPERALWESDAPWPAGVADEADRLRTAMAAATLERLPTIPLAVLEDLLLPEG